MNRRQTLKLLAYLKHQYRRGDYIDAWWNVVNWNKAANNFKRATS